MTHFSASRSRRWSGASFRIQTSLARLWQASSPGPLQRHGWFRAWVCFSHRCEDECSPPPSAAPSTGGKKPRAFWRRISVSFHTTLPLSSDCPMTDCRASGYALGFWKRNTLSTLFWCLKYLMDPIAGQLPGSGS